MCMQHGTFMHVRRGDFVRLGVGFFTTKHLVSVDGLGGFLESKSRVLFLGVGEEWRLVCYG